MGLHIPPLPLSLLAAGCILLGGLAACSSSSDEASPDEGATPNPNGKSQGEVCAVGFDCRSGLCKDGKCAPSSVAATGSPTDGEKNGDETDVDCGGSRAPKCGDTKSCAVGNDCKNAVCKAEKCAAPGPTDGVKNTDETDVDCGGKGAPKCATGKACGVHGDCKSDACSYEKKCVEFKGCTGHAGGDTCGEGETGDPAAKHESCCTRIAIPDGPQGKFSIDKYHVTAGRMRAFAERYQGNLKMWAATAALPASWPNGLEATLPENMDDVHYLLGPGGKEGCNVANQGGRTFFQPPIDGNAAEKSDFTQEVLDEKALNCATWNIAMAVCAFDGGHLVSGAEMKWVYENRSGAPTTYPWQFADKSAYSPQNADIRLVHRNSYSTANPPAGMRLVGGQYPLDHAFWIAPPGRRPKGANMHGVQDAAGNLMPWVRDGKSVFVWTQSWEKHEKDMTPTNWASKFPNTPDGYYALGARCSY